MSFLNSLRVSIERYEYQITDQNKSVHEQLYEDEDDDMYNELNNVKPNNVDSIEILNELKNNVKEIEDDQDYSFTSS